LADRIDEVESRIHIITDGSLVALAKSDEILSKYGIIVVDEAHQHTVATDVLLGLARELVTTRDDLKIVIMSATIDVGSFRNFFPGSEVVEVAGRTYPVHINYLEKAVPSDGLVEKIIETIVYVHLNGKPGNILVFASGVPQIRKIAKGVTRILLNECPFDPEVAGNITIHSLYAKMPAVLQQDAANAVAPAPRDGKPSRKVIIATNMAETSVSLIGVTHVIDSCRVKSKIYNPEDESYSLYEQWISKAQAKQRAGRAGRTQEGFAWRMCTEAGFRTALTDYTVPEMQNGDMLREILDLIKIGRDPISFTYPSPPATETVVKALGIHRELGTLTIKNNALALTQRGEQVSLLPVNVFSALAILESMKPELSCCDEMVMLVSMLEALEGGSKAFENGESKAEKKVINSKKVQFGQSQGEHITLLNLYLSWRQASFEGTTVEWLSENRIDPSTMQRADTVRKQLLRLLVRHKKFFDWNMASNKPQDPQYYTKILTALAGGYFLQVAKIIPKSSEKAPQLYETVRHGNEAELHRSISFRPGSSDWVIYDHLDCKGLGNSHLKIVTPIPLDLLLWARPEYWCNVDFKPAGRIQDALVHRIKQLTGCNESEILVDMPSPPPTTQQQ
jgi:HrpA-like RNA helicase